MANVEDTVNKEYIDKHEAYLLLKQKAETYMLPATKEAYEKAAILIDSLPIIEAQPVKHGRWIKHRIDDPKSILHGAVKDTTCSVCGKSTPYNTEYCMHCGARIDGENK